MHIEKIYAIQIDATHLINTEQNINSNSEDSQNLGKKSYPSVLDLEI